MEETTNKDRAYWAEAALEAFAGEVMPKQPFSEIEGEDLECLWRDLISDMCHFARLKGWDFEAMITTAIGMHNEEAECDPDEDEEDEGQRIEAAFKASTHYREGHTYDFHEEDGRWWVTERETGRGWGVSRGTGRDAADGYLFEVLAQGE